MKKILVLLFLGLISVHGFADDEAGGQIMHIPNYIIGPKIYKIYYCIFTALDSKNNILPQTSYGIELKGPSDAFKYSPDPKITWIVTRTNDVISIESRNTKNEISFSASSLDGSALSALSHDPHTQVICNHVDQDQQLYPSNKNPSGVVNSAYISHPKTY